MRKEILLLIFMVCGFWSCLTDANSDPIDVYLIGGQSNATGQGYMENIPSSFSIDTSVLFYYSRWLNGSRKPELWGSLVQASESPDKFGVELSMGTELQSLFPGRKIAIIKHALSGSSLYRQWHPGKDVYDTLQYGEEYVKFVNTVNNGLDKLKSMGYTPDIKGMVWQQGEADARDIAGMDNSLRYGHNLRHFILRIREQFQVSDMLFVYGYVIPVPLPRFTGRKEIREAQRKIDQDSGEELSTKGAFVVSTDDLSLRKDDPHTRYPEDVVHFGTSGILKLGKRFAHVLHQEYSN